MTSPQSLAISCNKSHDAITCKIIATTCDIIAASHIVATTFEMIAIKSLIAMSCKSIAMHTLVTLSQYGRWIAFSKSIPGYLRVDPKQGFKPSLGK